MSRNHMQKLKSDYTEINSGFKEIKSLVDSLNPYMTNLVAKISMFNERSKESKSSLSTIDSMLKKILSNAGSAIGHAAMGNMANSSKLLSDLPKILMSMISGQRANGGPVAANQAYLVGERGPELFVPNRGGNITANHQMNKPAINLVMNINTKDADSFRKSQNQILSEALSAINKAGRNL